MGYFYVVLIVLGFMLVGYLIGGISNARIICNMKGVDITKIGSGNAGGTNVGRALGKKYAVLTVVLDVLKTIIPMWTVFFIVTMTPFKDFVNNINPNIPLEVFYYSIAFASGLGHCFPVYYHFKGGKAVSCFGGFILGTNFLLAAVSLAFFFLLVKLTKKVSLGSIFGVLFCFIVSLFLVFFPIDWPVANYVVGNWYFGNGIMFDQTYVYSITS